MLTSYKLNFLIKSISHLQLHNSKNDVKNVPLGVQHWGITLKTHHLYLEPDTIFIILYPPELNSYETIEVQTLHFNSRGWTKI